MQWRISPGGVRQGSSVIEREYPGSKRFVSVLSQLTMSQAEFLLQVSSETGLAEML